MNDITTLRASIGDLAQQADRLRQARTALSAEISQAPTDAALIDRVLGIGAELQRVQVVQDALQARLEPLVAADEAARHAAAVAAVQGRKDRVLKQSAARAALAAKVQQAGEALIASVKEWKATGQRLHDDALAVLRAHHGADLNRINEALMFVGPAAAGTGGVVTEAVVSIAQRAVEALGSAHSDALVVFKAYRPVNLDFTAAAKQDHEVLVDRFKGLAKPVAKARP